MLNLSNICSSSKLNIFSTSFFAKVDTVGFLNLDFITFFELDFFNSSPTSSAPSKRNIKIIKKKHPK